MLWILLLMLPFFILLGQPMHFAKAAGGTEKPEESDKEETKSESRKDAKDTEKVQTEPDDPYAGLSEEDRQYQKAFDNVVSDLTPADRYRILELARERHEELQKEVKEKESELKTATDEGESKGELAELRNEIKQLRDDMAKAKQSEILARREAEFRQTLSSELAKDDAFANNPNAQKLVARAVAGALIEHRGKYGNRIDFDTAEATRAAMKEIRDIVKDATGKNQVSWLEQKLKDAAETAGEGAGGATPGRTQFEPKAESMDDGTLAESVKKEFFNIG